jgi:hypothetical protein
MPAPRARPPARVARAEASEELVEKVEIPGVGQVCNAPLVETKFSTTRVVAGESISADKMECQLEPRAQVRGRRPDQRCENQTKV